MVFYKFEWCLKAKPKNNNNNNNNKKTKKNRRHKTSRAEFVERE